MQALGAMVDHDRSYKLLFSHPELVRDLLCGFVQETWVAQLDFSSLEKVDPQYVGRGLSARTNDIVWRARWGAGDIVYVYLMFEFQSETDPYMPVRMLTYAGLLYEGLIRTKQLTPDGQLPPMLPLVLYNGSPPWSAEQRLTPLIQAGPRALEQYRPDIQYLLIDEGRYSEDELLPMRNLVAAMFRLENSRTGVQVGQVLGTLSEWLRSPEQAELRRSFIEWVRGSILKKIPDVPVDTVHDLAEMQTMVVSLSVEWKAEARREGLEEGRREGFEEGQREGQREGRREGRRLVTAVLSHQLRKRFGDLPDWVAARLGQASMAQLEYWAEELLSAESLEALFRETESRLRRPFMPCQRNEAS